MRTEIFNQIKLWAQEEGFPVFGVCDLIPLQRINAAFDTYLSRHYHAGMAYLENNVEKRKDPARLVEGARSIMVFLAPYPYQATCEENGLKIASYSKGIDYHFVIKNRLRKIIDRIIEIQPDFCGREFTDSAPIFDRAWAAAAGTGFIGRNGLLINRELGNRVLIGTILSNLESGIKPDENEIFQDRCGACHRCIQACPSGALVGPYTLDARKCISYQTIESRASFDEEAFDIDRHGWIFGCDECLRACPWYHKNKDGGWKEFITLREELRTMGEDDWKTMSNSAFKKRFLSSPLSRAGLKKIKNNLAYYDRQTTDRDSDPAE